MLLKLNFYYLIFLYYTYTFTKFYTCIWTVADHLPIIYVYVYNNFYQLIFTTKQSKLKFRYLINYLNYIFILLKFVHHKYILTSLYINY